MQKENTSYLVIARKYRPKKFSEVVGQEHVIQTLRNAITSGRIAHAYLLVGPRGIGKTTTARLLAAALNAPGSPSVDADPKDPQVLEILEGRSLDVREIDGASNNGVEQVRELRDDVRYTPQSGRYKIYIIDEVHMLSTAAFNALLKTLEEPPPYVKFIFATTEVQKVPGTIMSRCQRFDLRRIPTELIARQLAMIVEAEGVKVEPGALHAIARLADGGMRDAQSILDQMISFCGENVKESDVLQILGIPSRTSVLEILSFILTGNTSKAWQCLSTLESQGKDFSRILSDLVIAARELLVAQQAPELIAADLPPEDLAALEPLKPLLKPAKLLRLTEQLSQAENRMRFSLHPKVWLEVTIATAAQISKEVDLEDVISAMSKGGVSPCEPPSNSAAPTPELSAPLANHPPPLGSPMPSASPSLQQAWQEVLTRIPSYLSHGIQASFQHNAISISVDIKMVTLLEQEWPKEKIEKELRAICPAVDSIAWNTHSSTPPPAPVISEEKNAPQETDKKSTKKSSPSTKQTKSDNPTSSSQDEVRKLTPQEMIEFQKDPQIRKALDKFGARLIGIKKISTA